MVCSSLRHGCAYSSQDVSLSCQLTTSHLIKSLVGRSRYSRRREFPFDGFIDFLTMNKLCQMHGVKLRELNRCAHSAPPALRLPARLFLSVLTPRPPHCRQDQACRSGQGDSGRSGAGSRDRPYPLEDRQCPATTLHSARLSKALYMPLRKKDGLQSGRYYGGD